MSAVTLRRATDADVPAMQRVRGAVLENRLVSVVLTEGNYHAALAPPGRGWVALEGGVLRGFAVGDARTGNVWALFVEPGFERRGLGRALFDTLTAWLAAEGPERLWLTTEPGTRAERFYRAAGWTAAGTNASGETVFERLTRRPDARP